MLSQQPIASAVILLDESGRIEAASEAALELLGTTLDDLRSSTPGGFAAHPTPPGEEAALRTQWEAADRPELAGESTIRRGDGREIRIRYLIVRRDDGRLEAIIEPSGGPSGAPGTVFGLGNVLTQWRAAERQLAAIEPDSPEWARVSAEIARLRAIYQDEYRARRPG